MNSIGIVDYVPQQCKHQVLIPGAAPAETVSAEDIERLQMQMSELAAVLKPRFSVADEALADAWATRQEKLISRQRHRPYRPMGGSR